MARNLLWRAVLLCFALTCLGPGAAWALPTASPAPPDVGTAEVGKLVAKKGKKAKKRGKKRKKKANGSSAEEEDEAMAPSAATPPPPDEDNSPILTTRRGPARVDFDDRLIQGQTNKSGAIYIFERKSSELHSMVRRRTSFRDEIFRSIE